MKERLTSTMALGHVSQMFHGSSGRRAPRRCHELQGCACPLQLQPRNPNGVRANRYVRRGERSAAIPVTTHAHARCYVVGAITIRRDDGLAGSSSDRAHEQRRAPAQRAIATSASLAVLPGGVGQETDGSQQLRTRSDEEFSAATPPRCVRPRPTALRVT